MRYGQLYTLKQREKTMKNGKLHLIIGTCLCAATALLFAAFYGRLPDVVPIQFAADGSVGNAVPKPLLAFGLLAVFTAVNLVKCLPLSRKRDASALGFYLVPGVAALLTAGLLWLALRG